MRVVLFCGGGNREAYKSVLEPILHVGTFDSSGLQCGSVLSLPAAAAAVANVALLGRFQGCRGKLRVAGCSRYTNRDGTRERVPGSCTILSDFPACGRRTSKDPVKRTSRTSSSGSAMGGSIQLALE